jgi:hypothetical protein
MEMECLELTYKRPQPVSLNGYYYGYDNWEYKPSYEFKAIEPKRTTKAFWSKELAQEFGVEYKDGNNNNNIQEAEQNNHNG